MKCAATRVPESKVALDKLRTCAISWCTLFGAGWALTTHCGSAACLASSRLTMGGSAVVLRKASARVMLQASSKRDATWMSRTGKPVSHFCVLNGTFFSGKQ